MQKKRKINPKNFAQASKGQKIGYRWTVRERKIDGKKRLVRIRCIKGKIEMQVLDDLRYIEKPKKRITKPKIRCPKCDSEIVKTKKGRGFCEECNEITMSIYDMEEHSKDPEELEKRLDLIKSIKLRKSMEGKK